MAIVSFRELGCSDFPCLFSFSSSICRRVDATSRERGSGIVGSSPSLDLGLCVVCYGNVRERPCESMFSAAGLLVYRRFHVCRFACNVRMNAEELLPVGFFASLARSSLSRMDPSRLSWHRSRPGHLREAAVVWAPAYCADYLVCLWPN